MNEKIAAIVEQGYFPNPFVVYDNFGEYAMAVGTRYAPDRISSIAEVVHEGKAYVSPEKRESGLPEYIILPYALFTQAYDRYCREWGGDGFPTEEEFANVVLGDQTLLKLP